MSEKYEELAARAERGELTAKPGTRRQGEDSRDQARQALVDATGASTLDEAVALVLNDTELRQEIAARVAADGPTSPRPPRRAKPSEDT